MISVEQFVKLFPQNKHPQAWTDALNAILPKYGINTRLRIMAFLAQCGHESNGFTDVIENLNYSAEALTLTWPKRFPQGVAEEYARQPERIANRAYADRMGNGPESSGDGWKHRGRGVIQITGKDKYLEFAKAAGKSYDDVFAYLETKEGAIESACWFWVNNGCNALADADKFIALTKRINGGTNGIDDRMARYELATKLFM
ncbi:glycoside hydrolase family 19 protein [Geobacter pelophilus]|uniref:Glycoside hydrolase family 19 protein n=1 Tax=Geoanaerobacter pelophilus TaxID=60036 RepID=A0AAW4LCI4_9BACT|nr:glycoside hydrolase family 19 protein [Geoanaerobacter pelophilus]MBT0665739.1 glycoside hydrolase family 19 protein [Geoanaerobacter pelophilus]